VIVGAEAKQRRIIDPRNTVYSSKRLIGRTFKSKEVATSVARMPYQIKEGLNQQPVITTRAGEFAFPEISAIILDHMRSIAQKAIGVDVTRTVITVPANFTDAQRSATATAGAIAGLTVVRVLNEPTAAALAYGHGRTANETIAVYDFGGGTFDITILRLHDEVYEVLGTGGDTFLGGDDIDERLVDHMVQGFLRDTRTDLRGDELAMQRLRAVAEQTKIELSRRSRAIIKVDEIAYGPGGAPLDLQLEIARDEFISQIADLVDRTFPVCEQALISAQISGVDEVLLVGGTTKMPYVRERVQNFFGRPPRTDVNPDEAVALGAAVQADALERVLAGGPRQTTRSAIAPPAPPMEVKPEGSGALPPPTPADAVARKLAPPSRQTQPRLATTEQRLAQNEPDTVVLDDDEVTGILSRPKAAGAAIGRITRPGTAPSVQERVAAKRLAVPPPVPGRRTAPQDFSGDTNVATNPALSDRARLSFEDIELTGLGSDVGDALTDVRADPADSMTNVRTDPGHFAMPDLSGVQEPEPVIARGPPSVQARTPPPQPLGGAVPRPEPPPPAPPVRAPVILDVVPQGLGIGTIAGFCDTLVARHTQLPCEQTRKFTTSSDWQTDVNIRVCIGDSRRIADNVILGQVTLDGIDKAPRGQPSILVSFRIDESGILRVSAKDETTGAEQQATLSIAGGQSTEEIEAAKQRFREITGVADS